MRKVKIPSMDTRIVLLEQLSEVCSDIVEITTPEKS